MSNLRANNKAGSCIQSIKEELFSQKMNTVASL